MLCSTNNVIYVCFEMFRDNISLFMTCFIQEKRKLCMYPCKTGADGHITHPTKCPAVEREFCC